MLASVRARRSIAVEGVVQGVGFRPFVHGLASRLGLGGFVCNRAGGVLIEVEGESQALERFLEGVDVVTYEFSGNKNVATPVTWSSNLVSAQFRCFMGRRT